MSQRRHPRIQLPLLVELNHPSMGSVRCTARDVSESGVFVQLENPSVKPGARLRVTLLNALSSETLPTPTVETIVRRVEPDGVGLEFSNSAGRHLWHSVERLRTELAIGRDYFQVHVSARVVNDSDALLLVQQNGRWTFPGCYLLVGQPWQDSLTAMLRDTFELTGCQIGQVVWAGNSAQTEVPEAALLRLYVDVQANDAGFAMSDRSRYSDCRWVDRRRAVEDSTFASALERDLADARLKQLIEQSATGR
ncbi:MAG: PilZ domain-containing protein [Pseudomonadales bacterium]